MKALLSALSLLVAVLALSGCATPFPTGAIYTGVTMPSAASENVTSAKQGTAECISVLGLVAVGDCSINAAVRAGSITRISHVDFKAKNILGVYGQYTTIVRGE